MKAFVYAALISAVLAQDEEPLTEETPDMSERKCDPADDIYYTCGGPDYCCGKGTRVDGTKDENFCSEKGF